MSNTNDKDHSLLKITGLHVEYEGVELLNNVNLHIPSGEVHVLLGANGSGKTTLLMTIMGFSGYEVTKGNILYKGQDISSWSVDKRAREGISLALQRPPTVDGVSLQKLVDRLKENFPDTACMNETSAKKADVERFLNRFLNDGLSGGEIRRSELFQLLCMKSHLSLLDEIDSGVDLQAIKMIAALIEDLLDPARGDHKVNPGALLITHSGAIINYLRIDMAHVMVNGTIVCSGESRKLLESISLYGYERCMDCKGEKY
ncbi:MAG: ABC transporter ATP-binding protein [Sphaerochaetaceae bacterium]